MVLEKVCTRCGRLEEEHLRIASYDDINEAFGDRQVLAGFECSLSECATEGGFQPRSACMERVVEA